MIKVVKKSHHLYTENLKQEGVKKSTVGEKAKADLKRKKFKGKEVE